MARLSLTNRGSSLSSSASAAKIRDPANCGVGGSVIDDRPINGLVWQSEETRYEKVGLMASSPLQRAVSAILRVSTSMDVVDAS